MSDPAPVPPPGPTAHAAALAYAARGWRVVPIIPGEKYPPMKEWQDAATNNVDTVNMWFTQLYRNHGVGLAMGPGSGVWCLDVDVSDGKDGEASYEALIAEIGDLPPTVTAVTGSGGFHYLFKWPTDGTDIRNDQSGKLGAGLDIRGDGGQIVAAPTIHKDTKVAYRWVTGYGPGEIEVADTPPALLAKLREVTERVAPPKAPTPPPRITSTGDDDDTPAEWINSHTTWDHLLTTDGWTLVRTLANGEQRWRRPGKNDGMSATVGHDGRDVLKVFTSSVAALEADKAYSRFGYVAATRHAGDRSACARSVRKDMPTVEHEGIENGLWNPPAVELEPVDEPEHGWEPANLGEVLAAGYEQPQPSLLRRTDGAALFYPSRINGLFGKSGSGKSWLAMFAAAQEMNAGHDVIYVDLEDHVQSVAARFKALGVDHATITRHLIYISPLMPWNHAGRTAIAGLITERDVTLAVIDSTGEAMALDGAKPNDDDATAGWFRAVPRWLALMGVAVVVIDHQPKNTEGGATEIGSQRKRAAIDGATYHVDAKVSPARGVTGYLKVTCEKDRNGTYQKGSLIADVEVSSNEAGTEVQIKMEAHEPVRRPTNLMGKISAYLQDVGPEGASMRQVEKDVPGNGAGIRKAMEVLIDEGYASQSPRSGRGGGMAYRHLKPFDEVADGLVMAVDNPLTNTEPRTASEPRPNRVQPEMDALTEPRLPRPAPSTRGRAVDAVRESPETQLRTHFAPQSSPPDDEDEDLDTVWFDDDGTPIEEETP